jgi:hypothetical protein
MRHKVKTFQHCWLSTQSESERLTGRLCHIEPEYQHSALLVRFDQKR